MDHSIASVTKFASDTHRHLLAQTQPPSHTKHTSFFTIFATESSYRSSGIELLRVPVRDFDPVDLREKLPQCVRTLDQLLATDHSVYLHCTAGAGRPPTAAVHYLHLCLGPGLDQAQVYIKGR